MPTGWQKPSEKSHTTQRYPHWVSKWETGFTFTTGELLRERMLIWRCLWASVVEVTLCFPVRAIWLGVLM